MMQNHSYLTGWKRGIFAAIWSLSILSIGQAHAVAETAQVAMADVGAIKNDLAPTDPSANITWAQLNEQQRAVLTPLASEWDSLRPWQREKMLDIAKEYPKMDAQKQQRIQHQLVKWSRMTPFERENARKRYQQFQTLSPEKREQLRKQWKEHKQKSALTEGYDPEFDSAEH